MAIERRNAIGSPYAAIALFRATLTAIVKNRKYAALIVVGITLQIVFDAQPILLQDILHHFHTR